MWLRSVLQTALWLVVPVTVVVALSGADIPWRFTEWNEMPLYRLALPLLYPTSTGLTAALACRRTGASWTEAVGAALLAAVAVLLPATPWLLERAEQDAAPGSPIGFAHFDCLRWILVQIVLFTIGPFLIPAFDPPVRRSLFGTAAGIALLSGGIAIVLAMASSGATDSDHAILETGLFLSLSLGVVAIGLAAARVLPAATWAGGLSLLTYPLTIAGAKLILWLLPVRF